MRACDGAEETETCANLSREENVFDDEQLIKRHPLCQRLGEGRHITPNTVSTPEATIVVPQKLKVCLHWMRQSDRCQ